MLISSLRKLSVLSAAMLLTACVTAGSSGSQIVKKGESVILMGFMLSQNYSPRLVDKSVAEIYQVAIEIEPGRGRSPLPPIIVREDPTDPTILWGALRAKPGDYFLSVVREFGKDGPLDLFGKDKDTDFVSSHYLPNQKASIGASDPNVPAFSVGADETVFIGLFDASLTTIPTTLGGRYLKEAVKSYTPHSNLALLSLSQFKFPSMNYRSVDVFAGRPGAFRELATAWTRR